MKTGICVFLAAFVAFGASWLGFVYAPMQQLGGAKQTAVLQSTETWPRQRTGDATLGLQVYRACGCAACHTEQIRQTSVANEISLTDLATYKPEDFAGFLKSLMILPELINASNEITASLDHWDGKLPRKLYSGDDSTVVTTLAEKLKAVHLKTDARIVPGGADIARGWGCRQSVARDYLYLYDQPVQLGNLRAGPDLSNIGLRADINWQLQHLYAPRSRVENSTMPAFRFLFLVQKKIDGQFSPEALMLPKKFAPAADCEVVPTPEAKHLAAYLASLKADAPLFEAPFTPVSTGKK